VALRRDERGGSRLDLKMCVSAQARAAARQAARKLFRVGLGFQTVFCFWMIRFSNPGSGTHCGSSFPMRRKPVNRLDTDIFGRPFGWSRIFAVDAAVLPSIPGTTLAFTVMANAFRIGATAPPVLRASDELLSCLLRAFPIEPFGRSFFTHMPPLLQRHWVSSQRY
jgi:hypothetical protein